MKRRFRCLASVLLALGLLSEGGSLPSFGQAPPGKRSGARIEGVPKPSPRELAQSAFRSVVLLVMQDAAGQPVSLGSGFFIEKGILVTNLHVVTGAARGTAKLVGQTASYKIAGVASVDANHDLVLLSVPEAQAPAIPLGDSSLAAVGDEVFVVGNPRGLEGTFSQGIISGIRQVGSDSLLQLTAPISPGSSGGPVLDARGKVIGVAALTLKDGQNLNFAIPASYLVRLLSEPRVVRPLGEGVSARRDSVVSSIAGRQEDAVTVGQFYWDTNLNFSVSIKNNTRSDIKNVLVLVVFHDAQGNPLDFSGVKFEGIIPAGLAKRASGWASTDAVLRMTTRVRLDTFGGLDSWDKAPYTKLAFRVLDFSFAE